MKEFKYLIIGGGMAGGKACEGIREMDGGGSIGLVTKENHPPYEKPPLSKKFLQGAVDLDRVYLKSKEDYQDMDVELLQGKAAVGLSPEDHLIKLDDGEELGYEKLLIATGGSAIRLPIWGSELENVFTLRSIEDAQQIREAAGENTRALVMGGSFIGAEVAASISQLGTQVVQIFPEPRLLDFVVPRELSQHLQDIFEENNVRILPETISEGLEGEKAVQRAILNNGELIDVDFVVMGVGIKINNELAEAADLDILEDGTLSVNEWLQTSHPDIYAAGDVTSWPDPNSDQNLHVEHWDVARRQGRVAGRNMAGKEEKYTALPYFFSDLYDLSFEVWGEISNWENTVRRGNIEKGSFAYYYFADGRLQGVLAVDRPDEERVAMETLPAQKPAYAEVGSKLKDEDYNLRNLID